MPFKDKSELAAVFKMIPNSKGILIIKVFLPNIKPQESQAKWLTDMAKS
jgi:hypothetical protein